MLTKTNFHADDLVVYQITKQSSRPTLRASKVYPSQNGDHYRYIVEKYWIVRGVQEDGQLIVQTRKGKTRTVNQEDPCLRKAAWWEKWLYKHRFPVKTNSDIQDSSHYESIDSPTASGVHKPEI